MSYDGEVREDEWCSNHACCKWQCPKPLALRTTPPVHAHDCQIWQPNSFGTCSCLPAEGSDR
jgi:hypothetical protein